MSTAIAAARAKTKGKTLLKDILNAYGEIDSVEASAEAISDWNRRKKEAIANGTWVWRENTMAFAIPKSKVATHNIKGEFACLTTLSAELDAVVHGPTARRNPASVVDGMHTKGCSWSAVFDGKFYTCTNELHSETEVMARRCNWHAIECRSPTHSTSAVPDKTIAIPNEDALCLSCFATSRSRLPKHRQTPPAFDQVMIPGVHRSEAQKVQAKLDIVTQAKVKPTMSTNQELSKTSTCAWRGHKPGQKTFQPHVCHRTVLLHPIYGTYLPMCGYHQSPCVRNLTKGTVCPRIVQFNAYGLCHNHYEALMATLPFHERRADKTFDSPFDPPDVYMDIDKGRAAVAPHPLAPKLPPPPLTTPSPDSTVPSTSLIRGTLTSVFAAWTSPVQTLWWQINYVRQGPRIATRLQAIFRGKQARKQVHRMLLETYARKRTKAAILLQKHFRARQAKRHVVQYRDVLLRTSMLLQRMARGYISRRRVHRTRRFRRLCHAVGVYLTVRRAISILHFRVDTRRGLSRGSDRDRLISLSLLQRRHAARVLARAMRAWKKDKLQKRQQGELKFKTFLSSVTIQRAWKRYQKLKWLHARFHAAQRIQARIRGDLTRCLWANDPGISSTVLWINPRSGFAYVRHRLDPTASPSYSVVRRSMRRDVAARMIQLHFRGYVGRVAANTAWANMEKRWQWIDPSQDRRVLRTLLPHTFYHEDKHHHMRPIFNVPVPYRAFAYEFQGVVDLLDDQDGLRCANMPPRRPTPPTPWTVVECPLSADSTLSLRFPPTQSIIESSLLDTVGITSTKAMYPIGAIVYVHLPNKKMHPATITRIHVETDSFDVAFLPGLVSIRGIAITEAKNIHVSRMQLEPPPTRPVTLTHCIHAERKRVAALPTSAKLPDKSASRNIIPKRSWPDVASRFHALVTCVRDHHRRLLTEPPLWMRFVFDHRDFLDQYWLRLLHDIEHGHPTDPHYPSSCPMEGMILPLPHVAKWMKTKLLSLGLEATALANQVPPKPRHAAGKAVQQCSQHAVIPTTYVDDIEATFLQRDMRLQSPANSDRHASRDDLDTPNASSVSLADIHKLVYHLKSLPGHVPDHVLQVTTRNVRTFVCSHPACGRCFSTREGARLHKELHSNKPRFAGGNPLVDQYMHKHWPPESPWRDENQMAIQGTANTGFQCPVCDRSFPTRREALRHASAAHGHEQPREQVSTTNPNIIWLGTSRTINDIANRFPELRRPRVCPTCSRKMAQPDPVCRLYPSVCILMESAVIFATDFKALSPQFHVTCPDCGFRTDTPGSKSSVYLNMHVLCRDRHGVDWALGNLYHAPPAVASLGEALILGYDYTYEVLLQSPLVCMPLTQCNGYAIVHTCSRTYFHRKVKAVIPPGQVEKFCRVLRPSSQHAKPPPSAAPTGARPEQSA
ncbi:hypothetical protein H310_11294 [Aphanomyces invadans]|uniref:C2H2-type domain-containing protein n=1 Tax=Aphanomyces invadans TaxID=157072 RepID=A0A024TMR5_9STRA|nr:hypothetical protein H310_11294 [Aphanomyces invadans]ETV95420.1 hypothetical protein H310_11294 [Aphanomyces invadans]|eukprot:XP_008876121.1 hypothetical protein H310_11294 [Aphanomyces invadans]